jgi:6,7-dimethyl-8-ribityllumazine synthase
MVKVIEGSLNAEGIKVGIVVSRFNDFITGKLLDGAVDALVRHGANDADIEVVKVPGAFEIPMAAKKMLAEENACWQKIRCDYLPGSCDPGSNPAF